MEYTIQIPEYDNGFVFEWEDNSEIKVNLLDKTILIKANKEGLISLARHLINLSQDHFKDGYDFHLDSFNSLEENSNELIIQKIVPTDI